MDTTITLTCLFKECKEPCIPGTRKCALHKNRDRCHTNLCGNQVYARGLCVRHGGRRKCSIDGCKANARSHSVCSRHGAPKKKKLCRVEGCTKFAHAKSKCVAHGGGRKCKIGACPAHARIGGVCVRHGREEISNEVNPISWEPTSELDLDISMLFNLDDQFESGH